MSDQRQRQVVSARKWASEHEAGSGKSILKIPAGVRLMLIQKAGPIRFDIIPFVVGKGNPNAAEGELHWERTFWIHRGIGPNNESFVCPAKSGKSACPICEYRKQRFDDPDITDKEVKELGSLKPKERQLFNVVSRDVEDAGIQLFEYSYFLFGDFLKKKLDNMDPDDDFDRFADPKFGYILKVGVSEKKMDRGSCFEMSDIEFKKRPKPYPDSVIDDAYCLDDLLKIPTYEELKKAFMQVPDEDEDDAPKTARKGGGVGAKTTQRRDEEEEEAEAPKTSRRAPKEDDDDEPAPSTSRKRPPVEDDEPAPKAKAKPADEDDEPAPEYALGDLVYYKGGEYEVKKISPDGKLLTLEDEDGESFKGIQASLCKPFGPEEAEEEKPKAKTKSKPADDDDEPAPKAKRKAPKEEEEEPEEEAPKPKRNRPAPPDDDDDLPPPKTRRGK